MRDFAVTSSTSCSLLLSVFLAAGCSAELEAAPGSEASSGGGFADPTELTTSGGSSYSSSGGGTPGAIGSGGLGSGGTTGSGGSGIGAASSGGALGSGGTAAGGTGSGGTNAGTGGVVGTGGDTPGTGGEAPASWDVTFYVVSDTHADPPEESYDLRATARAINAVAKGGQWPGSINGKQTGFEQVAIAPPRGVVLTGDITGWGTAPTEINTFRHYFQKGNSGNAIEYPAYIGLGNHDVASADRGEPLASQYRAMYWTFVDERHKGPGAPVPVTSFDGASHSYSWDWDEVHLIQTHLFPGDTNYGLSSNLSFVQSDLAARAADGRPVFLFHHYGMDAFGTQDRWWTAAQRTSYRNVLSDYNVISIFVGHSHAAFQYEWEGRHVIHVNNAKAENGSGNNDGNGSFAIVRVRDGEVSMVTCRWLNDQGGYELIEPFYHQTW